MEFEVNTLNWTNYVINKESLDFLYNYMPTLNSVFIKSLDIQSDISTIWVTILSDELPDKIPSRGKWSKSISSVKGVFLTLQFNLVENIQINGVNTQQYSIKIGETNVISSSQLKQIKVVFYNEVSNIIFTAYNIRICSIKPFCESTPIDPYQFTNIIFHKEIILK
jgi:hypothetical protein